MLSCTGKNLDFVHGGRGVEVPAGGTNFIRQMLDDRFKRHPPSPRTAVLAEALLRSSEGFKKKEKKNENEKPIMNSMTANPSREVNTTAKRGGKIITGKGSRTPAGEEFQFRGRRVWTSDEDECIRQSVEKHGKESWTLVAEYLATQFGVSGRTGKQCWER